MLVSCMLVREKEGKNMQSTRGNLCLTMQGTYTCPFCTYQYFPPEGDTVGIRQQNNPTPWELDIPGTKKKRNSKIFPLRFPFNAKKAKCRFGQISPKLECGVDEYLCFPYVGTKHVKTNGKRVSEVFIQWYCLRGNPSMLCNGRELKRYVFVNM